MEDTLGEKGLSFCVCRLSVLILVLMEDTLGVQWENFRSSKLAVVLILVLMEDTLGELRLIFLYLSLFEVYLLLAERFS